MSILPGLLPSQSIPHLAIWMISKISRVQLKMSREGGVRIESTQRYTGGERELESVWHWQQRSALVEIQCMLEVMTKARLSRMKET